MCELASSSAMMEPRSKKSKPDDDEAKNNPAPARRGRGRPKGSKKTTKIVFPFPFKSNKASSSASSKPEEAVADEVSSPDIINTMNAATDTKDLKILSSSEFYDQTEKTIHDLYKSHKEAVKEIKLSQWCSVCGTKSRFPCCWNTSYCSLECQKIHWVKGHAGPCQHSSHQHQEEPSSPELVSESEL